MPLKSKLPVIKKLVKFLLGFPLTVLAVFFILQIIYSNWMSISENLKSISLTPVLFGLFFIVLFFPLKAGAWKLIMQAYSINVEYRKSFYALSLSELRRYIPGNVFAAISRVHYFQRYGGSKKLLVGLQGIEALILILSAIVVSVPGLIFVWIRRTELFGNRNIELLLIGLVLIVIAFVILFLTFKVASKNRVIKQFLSKEVGYAFLLCIVAWIFFGLGNYFIAFSIQKIPLAGVIELSSIFVLSWLIGFLAIVVPMGIGVREVVLTFLLSPIISLPVAAGISVFARLAFVLAEGVALFCSHLLNRFSGRFYKILSNEIDFIIVMTLIGLHAIYFAWMSSMRYVDFLTGRFDLGNMDQTVWNTIHGRVFMFTNPDGTEVISRLSVHADFILILLSPLYLIWEDPRMLLVLQGFVISLGAVFVFLLSKKVLNSTFISYGLTISYLLNFWVGRQSLFDFHAVSLATTFFLGAFYFLYIKRWYWFALFLILGFITKENSYIVGVFFGLYLIMKGYKYAGSLLALLCVGIFYLLIAQIVPGVRGGEAHFGLSYFEALGDNPQEILMTFFTRPDIVLKEMFSNGIIGYLSLHLLPVGFVALASPFYLLFASGDFLINLLSKNIWLRTYYFHYGALIVPFVYVSSVFGIKRLLRIRHITPIRLGSYLIAVSLITSWAYGILPGSRWPSVGPIDSPLLYSEEVRRVLQTIPTDMKIAASNTLASHLSYRQDIYVLPHGIEEADLVVVLIRKPFYVLDARRKNEIVNKLSWDYGWRLVYQKEDFYMFSRRNKADFVESLVAR